MYFSMRNVNHTSLVTFDSFQSKELYKCQAHTGAMRGGETSEPQR